MLTHARYAACLHYVGDYCSGWQRQPSQPSIQEAVEKALSSVANHNVTVVCAGRTDKGVHAHLQVVHFDSNAHRTPKQWLLGANCHLPPWVKIQHVFAIDNDFHARFSALSRSYTYIIDQSPTPNPFHHQRALWHPQPLCLESMQKAASFWLGEHDFSSFRAKHCQARSPIRTLLSIEVIPKAPHCVWIHIVGNAFLHHMIRNFIGVLLPIGRKQQPIHWAKTVLEAKQRALAGVTAPAHALYFQGPRYPEPYTKLNCIAP